MPPPETNIHESLPFAAVLDAGHVAAARLLDAALEAAEMGAWRCSFADQRADLSPRAQRLFGVAGPHLDRDEDTVRRIVHPDDIEPMQRAMRAACDPRGDGRYVIEYRVPSRRRLALAERVGDLRGRRRAATGDDVRGEPRHHRAQARGDVAAKYTDAGGRIVVRTAERGDEAWISVRDTGTGIDPESMARLFDLFVRGPESERRHREGPGVGLALARRLAELHDGSLSGASEGPGRGSEFTLRLPVAR